MIDLIGKINDFIWGFPFIILLGITSIYLSIKFGFPQIKILSSIKDIFTTRDNSYKAENQITSFKSLMTVLAGTLGTGNITGVATALVMGGVGSLFWLFISGILSMVISYAENLIVLKHRKKNKNGYYGGTMYVLDEVLDKKNLAIFFSVVVILCAVTTGTMTQSNALSTLLNTSVGINKKIIGIILSIITIYIIFGGKKRLAKASSVIIPLCSLTYIVLCISIIIINRYNILSGVKAVICSAFGIREITGGIVGLSISKTIGKGFSIGMFSNEAGMGSAPIFTATVEGNNIDKEARVAALSVVIDTLVLCLLTGITIVSTGLYNITNVNVMLKEVFGQVKYGEEILNICMIFFVVATIPCWEYYGEVATYYLFKNNISLFSFRVLYIIGIYIGCIVNLNAVWDLSGIFNAIMTIPNLYMIYKCISQKNYLQK